MVATGVTADGRREILGIDIGDSEDEVFWRAFLTSLKKRGLHGVQLAAAFGHGHAAITTIPAAIAAGVLLVAVALILTGVTRVAEQQLRVLGRL